METGDSAACDRDEQGREYAAGGEEAVAFCFSEAESGDREGSCSGEGRAQNADHGDDDHEVEKVRTQIVTGLQEDPYRSDGRDQDVEAKEPHPCVVGKRYRMEIEADEHDRYDSDDTDQGRGADRYVAAIYEEAEDHSQHDEQKRDHRCGEVRLKSRAFTHSARGCSCSECICNNGSESGNYQKQCKVTEDDEQPLSGAAHGTGNNFADGLAFVAY